MYEDRTQNYDPAVHAEYLIHDTPFPLPDYIEPCALQTMAINTTNKTERQQFSVVTVSSKS